MKRIITKFWGVGLILMLLSTLFIAATPVSAADPLTWNFKVDAPSGAVWNMAPGTDITDFDVNGMTMYAAVLQNASSATYLLQSTFGGGMWSDITARLPGKAAGSVTNELYDIDTVDMVAMAPDDPNVVVVVDSSSNATDQVGVAISANGGATWSSMGSIGALTTTQLKGVSISPVVTGGIRYVSVYGTNGTDTPVLYYYNYGAGVGAWKNAMVDFLGTLPTAAVALDSVEAVAFSPNFPSDYMAVALSADSGNTSVAGTLNLHILSFNSFKWDSVIAAGYPVNVTTGAAANTALTVNKASLALLPDYDGGDESLRIAFVGAAITYGTSEVGGIWRCYDSAPAARIYGSATAGIAVNSVAFDGTNLAAGSYLSNNVLRSADPLVTSPTFLGARNLKKIGVDDAGIDKVIVKFGGETLYGAKLGSASALSKSTDYGNVWNDFSLIDGGDDVVPFLGNPAFQAFLGAGTITDIYMTSAGDPWYLAAKDTNNTAVYRISMFAAQRVLCVPGAVDLILRGIASDPGVVYAAAKAGTDIYYSADGGTTRWYKRVAPQSIQDMAAESKETVYIGQNAGVNVYKSTNSGFTWSAGVNTKFSTGSINTMLSLSENNLLVGSTTGGVNYTTDGGTTWVTTFGTALAGGTGAVQIAATGLTVGSFIFAAPNGSNGVYRCEIGPSNPFGEFKTMNMPAASYSEVNTGLMLTNGVLYAISANATSSYINRTLMPAIPGTHTAPYWGTRFPSTTAGSGFVFNLTPSALRVSAGPPGSIMLYGVSNAATGTSVWYFEDSVATNGPKITGPADKAFVEMNAISGNAYLANLTWSRISKATAYTVQLALDPKFASIVTAYPVTSSLDPVSQIVLGTTLQPGTTYYWVVFATAPLTSAWSEVRSFTVKPGAASVPVIAAPANGVTLTSTKPAFSWSPVSGTTMYDFQLSEGTAFAAPVYATQVANAGVQLPLNVTLEQGKTYFWRVRSLQPVQGDWSTIANFTVAEPVVVPEPTPPVVVKEMPAPVINIPPAPPAQQIVIPPAPPEKVINPTYIWAIIIIGAVLVIAVIVLIVRTRRTV